MAKRKLENSATPATPPKKVPPGILKSEGTPSSLRKKIVTFPPPAELGDTLKLISSSEGDIDEEEMAKLIENVDTLKGRSLVLWLTELQKNVAALVKHKTEAMEGFVTELLKLKWAAECEAVATSYISFLCNLVSANTRYTRPSVKFIIENFKGSDREVDSDVFRHSHTALRGLLAVAPVIARDEILQQISAKFPYYKMPSYRQVCYISAVLEMIGYIPDSRDLILRLLVDRLIKLDAHLSRDYIDEAYRKIRNEEDDDDDDDDEDRTTVRKVDGQVESLDLFMKLMFTYIDVETHNENGEFDVDKAKPVVDSLLKVFLSHVIPTFNILHTQFLYLYLASLDTTISSRFLTENWKTFAKPDNPSILRQTVMAYIASFLSRGSFVTIGTVMTFLERITNWCLNYVRNKDENSSGMDFMYTDLNQHGPFYAACQAIFYVFAFRHTELTATEVRMKKLQSLSWQTLITSSLNPLRVCLPGIVSNFSALARNYQLAYCNSIIQRNNRINLPVVGSLSSSSSTAKPLLLDCFFPFDPYMLEESKIYIEDIYRPYTGEIFSDMSQDENESEGESEEESNETPDSGLGRRRKRDDSIRSSSSSTCSRTRRDSVGALTDILMQDLLPSPSPGFQ